MSEIILSEILILSAAVSPPHFTGDDKKRVFLHFFHLPEANLIKLFFVVNLQE
jgi:hypothetical protein